MANADPFEAFKANQKQSWPHFAPLESFTTPCAAQLVRFARVARGQNALDVACGTGVVAITAALAGARARGSDFTPELLEHARENAKIAEVEVEFREADVEALPYADREFDVVLSQFGHIFAPRPAVAVAEMLRVLKPGGTLAFSTWPPDLFIGRNFALGARYLPPPPGASPPQQWGDPNVVRERLGEAVKGLGFKTGMMRVPALSVKHHRWNQERRGPGLKLVETLNASDPARVDAYRRDYEALTSEYFEDNEVHMTFLMSRATKC